MSGYTPVFNSVFDGSLAGKWPESAVWLTILALCDKNGQVNMTPAAIAARTGWPVELLRQGIEALMQPDPDSQSREEDGRRLILLDPARSWGWRVVNHSKYREKARLQSKDSQRVASGLDAERKRKERAMSPDVPRCPPESPSSDSDSDSDSDSSDSVLRTAERAAPKKSTEQDHRAGVSGSAQSSGDSRIGVSDPDASLDKTIFAECRKVFGPSIGGMVNKAIGTPGKGKPFVIEMLEACRSKDPEAARAYFAAGLNGKPKQKAAERRRHPG